MCLYRLPERNLKAQQKIEQYATMHLFGDIGAGLLLGWLPLGGILAMGACIFAQGPLVYQPLARELAEVYEASPDEVTNRIIADAVRTGAVGDMAAEFTGEFFMEIAGELAREIGFSGVTAGIPFVGTVVSATIDAILASTLTWRVGTMISMYYQNGQRWVESRHHTYELTKPMTGWNPDPTGRVQLDGIPERHPIIKEGQLEVVRLFIETLVSVCSDREQIRQALIKKGLPDFLVSEAMRRFLV